MTLGSFLTQKRETILAKWFDFILETYPPDTARFLKQKQDRFTNPVGYNTYQEISKIYDGLIREANIDDLVSPLRSIIQIRAVQEFPASQAISFGFTLKKAIKAAVGIEIDKTGDEWLRLESWIDELTLRAFDIYVEFRGKLHEVRMKELNAQNEQARRLLQRMNII